MHKISLSGMAVPFGMARVDKKIALIFEASTHKCMHRGLTSELIGAVVVVVVVSSHSHRYLYLPGRLSLLHSCHYTTIQKFTHAIKCN